MKPADLLVEIGTEELPPKALKPLALAFRDGIVDGQAGETGAPVSGSIMVGLPLLSGTRSSRS